MTMEEVPEPSLANHQHLLDWLDDTISFIPSVPSFLDEPYSKIELKPYEWWDEAQNDKSPASSAGNAIPTTTAAAATPTTTYPTTLPKDEFIKKRKKPENHIIRSQQSRRRTNTHIEEGSVENQEDGGEAQRKLGRKAQTKESGSSSGGSNGSKEVRWAEQLLNPCATAIEAANIPRIQHLLYVLSEISSPSGDPNHRLASHGLRTLLRHLNSIGLAAAIPAGLVDGSGGGAASCFATTEPKLFRSALIKFQEVSPWFALPNSLANSCIHQILTIENKPKSLHIVDIGVSHGIQWPILLESLTRRPGGAPTLIRLTVAGSAAPSRPFSACPPGYDFPSHLLRYAKSISLNLNITQTKALSSTVRSPDEILVVSSQFRGLHGPLLRSIRDLEPDLVILTDLDGGSGVQGGGGFAEGFGRRAGLLWTFLESTSAAFKGRENAERRLVEGEAAGVLEVEMGEGREEWRERMKGLGFVEAEFGEEAVERARTLLKKYDGNWEMRAPSPAMAAPTVEEEAAVSLAWKGRSVSFCSLWMVAGRTRQRR